MGGSPLAHEPAIAAALARCRFPDGSGAVRCGVSGGADSLALLVLAVAAGLDATAVHVDHALRPGSDTEADLVAAAAARLGAGFVAITAPVAPGPDLEARARSTRHAALGPDALLGHTADDQAETVLLAMLRGAGLDGLAGIRPDRRPLLQLRRRDTEAVVAAAGLDPFTDPSNVDPRFRRNRVRHEVLPLLDDIAEREVAPVIARQADLLRADAELLDALAAELDPTDCGALASSAVPLARRAVRRWLRTLDDERHPPDTASVERVLGVARGDAVACHVTGGFEVRRSRGVLSVHPATPPHHDPRSAHRPSGAGSEGGDGPPVQ